jgi:hypothetical protein
VSSYSTTPRVSSYRRHKPSGQAVVTLSGRDIYLGKWGTKASRTEYDQPISEWLVSGRCLPRGDLEVSVAELALAYWRYAKDYYRKDGRPTGSMPRIRVAVRTFGDRTPRRRPVTSAPWPSRRSDGN